MQDIWIWFGNIFPYFTLHAFVIRHEWFIIKLNNWSFNVQSRFFQHTAYCGLPGGIGFRYPVKNRAYPAIPWKIFDFPDPEFSSSSFSRVFLSQLRAFCKTVTIEQLPRKIVPGYERGLPREKIIFMFYQITPELLVLKSRDHFISVSLTE